MSNNLSRRDFLKLAGATSAGLALSACGLTPTAIPTLTNTPVPTRTLRPSSTPTITETLTVTATSGPPTLRELADLVGIKLGSAVNGAVFDENNPRYDKRYMEIFQRDFNLAVIKDAAGWIGYEPSLGKEDEGSIWFIGSQIKALRRARIYDIRWHPLIYPRYSPDWLRTGVWKGEIGKDQLIEYMQMHITSVVDRFKYGISEWVVVNEPYRHWGNRLDPSKGDHDYFQNVIGDEYVDIAFQITRELVPTGLLIFNDVLNSASRGYHSVYGVSQAFNTNQTRKIVDRLKEKGLIDALGVQMHLDGANPPDKHDVIETIQSYGIPVYVTEFDVDMRNVRGTQEERFIKQAQVYADSLEACLQSGVCNNFAVWEWSDKQSSAENPQFGGAPSADASLYDDDLQPKPAWYALYDVLSQFTQKSNGITATSTP